MIKFAHINLITDNWKKLSEFYIKVFGCKQIFPERDLSGNWLDKATGISNAHIKGIHLELPGYSTGLPSLEIFEYAVNVGNVEPVLNKKGLGHIAFKVDNLQETLVRLLKNGGSQIGEITNTEIENVGKLSFVYTTDIDGNIIEIQSWDYA